MQEKEVAAAGMYKALGSPVRLAILRRLARESEICACDFHEVFNLAQPTVSQHLKVLRESGLARTRRVGNKIYYSVNPEAVKRLERDLGSLYPEMSSITA